MTDPSPSRAKKINKRSLETRHEEDADERRITILELMLS